MSILGRVNKPFLVLVILINVVIFFILHAEKSTLRVRYPKNEGGLPVLAQHSPFTLTRENGSEFSSKELEGKPWLASFIFTSCPNQCPMMIGKLSSFQKILPKDLEIVSVSVDPLHDSPDVLKSFSQKYGADLSRWVFLTGDNKVISNLMSELKLGGNESPSMHSLRFVLIDGTQRVRGYYDSEDTNSMKKMLQDARKLEQNNGK